MASYLCDLPPRTQTQPNYEKNIRQTQAGGHSTKYWRGLLNIVKVTKNKERLSNCHSQGEPKETWQLKGMWYTGWDPGGQKRY